MRRRSAIVLVGLRGSGKTTLGRRLARSLGIPFADTDSIVAGLAGVPPGALLRARGEEAFRRVEERAVRLACARPGPRVIAAGGGAPTRAGNRRRLRARGLVVYLRATPRILLARLRAVDGAGGAHESRRRPLLRGRTRAEEVRALLRERDALYRGFADVVVRVRERETPAGTARRIGERLRRRARVSAGRGSRRGPGSPRSRRGP